MARQKKQFCPHIYAEWGELFDAITEKERSEILLAITKFPEYEPVNIPIWNFIKSQLQKDYELFVEKCEKNGEISRNYWQNKKTNDIECNRTDTDGHPKLKHKLLTKTETETETKTETKKFIRPSLQEVEQYCTDRNNNINAQYFMSYYDARGWMIGKNKIKDWKACVRTWEQRNKKETNKNNSIEEIVRRTLYESK